MLAHALTGLVIIDIAVAATRLIVPTVSHYDYSFQLDIALKPVVVLWRVVFALTVAVS